MKALRVRFRIDRRVGDRVGVSVFAGKADMGSNLAGTLSLHVDEYRRLTNAARRGVERGLVFEADDPDVPVDYVRMSP